MDQRILHNWVASLPFQQKTVSDHDVSVKLGPIPMTTNRLLSGSHSFLPAYCPHKKLDSWWITLISPVNSISFAYARVHIVMSLSMLGLAFLSFWLKCCQQFVSRSSVLLYTSPLYNWSLPDTSLASFLTRLCWGIYRYIFSNDICF